MNSLHIRMCPCENVIVSFEGVLHVLGLFWRHEGTDVREVSVFLPKFGLFARGLLPEDLCLPDPIIAIGHVYGCVQGEMHPPGWPLLLMLSDSIGKRPAGCHIGQFALRW